MADLNEHCKVVLSSIIPNRTDLLDIATQHLSKDHFLDPTLQLIWQFLERYADKTAGGILTKDALYESLVKKIDAGRLAVYTETFDALLAAQPLDSDFKWSLERIKELAAERYTIDAITKGVDIFRTGVQIKKGKQTQTLQGHEDARAYVTERFAEIDQSLNIQNAPEGDIKEAGKKLLERYDERKAKRDTGQSLGILTGIPDIDSKTGGFQPGELNLTVGFTHSGKSQLCVNLLYQACVEQKLNGVYFTTETSKEVIDRRLISRHSRREEFGLYEGINSHDIKNGTVNAAQEDALKGVVHDLMYNKSYGKIFTAQVPNGATVATLEQKLYKLQKQFQVDFVVVDYLRLFRPEWRRGTEREDLNSILIDAKNVASTFDNGRGINITSPWQISRKAWEDACKTGYYTLSSTSETSEASNIANIIITMLNPIDGDSSRYTTLKFQVLKNRDGETASGINVNVDYATSYFSQGNINKGSGSSGPMQHEDSDFELLLGD